MTLHTNAGPRITKSTPQEPFTGEVLTEDCDVNAADQSRNAGCAIADNTGLTFGNDFNTNGGGVYATEWTSTSISIWFFPRGRFPSDIASASPSPSKNWGPANSVFTGDFNMDDHFKNLKIIFDTTFCGDWAGNLWNQSQCGNLAPSCEAFVSNNPTAFTEAYWAINTLQVFQDDGTSASSSAKGITVGVDPSGTAIGNPVTGNGRFIENAAVAHVDFQSPTNPKVKVAERAANRANWTPDAETYKSRKRGGSVLPRRSVAVHQS